MSKYFSQYSQDHFADFILAKNNGIFVDIGANDGVSYSNSYFFEKERNWKGICIEPIEETFKKLVAVRKCICLNTGVWKYKGTLKFYHAHGSSEMLSGIVDSFNDQHFVRLQEDVEKNGGKVEIDEIPVDSFNNILDKHQVKSVDFLSMDTEGSEYEILSAIDFDKVNISLIAVENQYGEGKIRDFLSQKNYVLIKRLGCDDIFIKKALYSTIAVRWRIFLFSAISFAKRRIK